MSLTVPFLMRKKSPHGKFKLIPVPTSHQIIHCSFFLRGRYYQIVEFCLVSWNSNKRAPTYHISKRAPTYHISKRAPTYHISKRAPTYHISKLHLSITFLNVHLPITFLKDIKMKLSQSNP